MWDVILKDHQSKRCTNVLLLSFKIRNKISSQIEWTESKAGKCIQKYSKYFPQILLTGARQRASSPSLHSKHQHCCRFCHFTSKKDFLIESPLSFSSKFPLLGGRAAAAGGVLAAGGAWLRVSQDFRVKLRN